MIFILTTRRYVAPGWAIKQPSSSRYLFLTQAEPEQIASIGPIVGLVQILRETMIDRGGKVRMWQRRPLSIRDRNQRHVAEFGKKRQRVAMVLAAMQSRQAGDRQMPEEREMEMVDMEVKHVEFGGM